MRRSGGGGGMKERVMPLSRSTAGLYNGKRWFSNERWTLRWDRIENRQACRWPELGLKTRSCLRCELRLFLSTFSSDNHD